MSEPLVHHEIVDYNGKSPFRIINLRGPVENIDLSGLKHHWHSDLEICYTVQGEGAIHTIDGRRIQDRTGKCVVINSESIHNIEVGNSRAGENELLAVILLISKRFIQDTFPGFPSLYFCPEAEQEEPEIGEVIMKLSAFADIDKEENEFAGLCGHIYEKGLILELLYYLVRMRLRKREQVIPVNQDKNLERIKGVLSYIENHYPEAISQEVIAKKFYFSAGYFSRLFHQTVGMTFVDYLAEYRSQQARIELLNTNRSITDIALDCGFSDARRCILSFKKIYGITPHQFRLMSKTKEDIIKR